MLSWPRAILSYPHRKERTSDQYLRQELGDVFILANSFAHQLSATAGVLMLSICLPMFMRLI